MFAYQAGLSQALRGLENDMLVMNLDSEKEEVKPTLDRLHRANFTISLEYIHLPNEATPITHTQNRARNNVSNRNEFLHKRRVQLAADAPVAEGSSSMQVDLPTCVRTDAALPVNRDVQMKYDVAKKTKEDLSSALSNPPPPTRI
ncbi:hypothetical protein K439DRAFT_1613372 [Ramaria rubella]|nr:hypothetical protein K439DRAFT_1613372 [Ramaria rubella]